MIVELTSLPVTANVNTGMTNLFLSLVNNIEISYATDYTPQDRIFTFTSNQPLCVDVTINDDIVLENTETFQIRVSSSDPDVSLDISTALVSILDNDCM